MEAEYEVQRTIKRAELTAFFIPSFDNKGIIDGLRKGERVYQAKSEKCRLWIKIWGELHELVKRSILVEVEHVKAHRSKEEKYMPHFEKFVAEGNEKADDLAKEGALLDKGFMAEARAETAQQEREEVHAALQYAASFHCPVERWKSSSQSRKKSGFQLTRRVRKRNIERSGVRKQIGIDV